MEIRKRKETDCLAAISRVYEESWRAAYQGLLPQAYLDAIPAGYWVPYLQQAGRECLLLLDGSQIVGTVSYCRSRLPELAKWGEIISIYLLPAYWGKGYGRMLFAAAAEELEKWAARVCFSGSWRGTGVRKGFTNGWASIRMLLIWKIRSAAWQCVKCSIVGKRSACRKRRAQQNKRIFPCGDAVFPVVLIAGSAPCGGVKLARAAAVTGAIRSARSSA